MIFIFLSCYPQPRSTEPLEPYQIGDATITELEVICEEDEWIVDVKTDAWTSNGTVWMVKSVENYEKHPIYSISAAADGSSDHLRMAIRVVPDWKDSVSGQSSGWLCSEHEALSIAIVIKQILICLLKEQTLSLIYLT